MDKFVAVHRDALTALQIAIDAQPDQAAKGAALFVTGGPMAEASLLTNYDWILLNAAYRLTHGGKL